ncbi:MAG: thymidine phosphorylase, partial [Burkholderiaceae bacterium]
MALVQEIIRNKRDGGRLSSAEFASLFGAQPDGATDPSNSRASDAQLAALAMAVFLNGLDRDETVALTCALRDSGRVLDWRGLDRPVVDKHSTGGVGDTVSLILGPLVAACGGAVPMISGRGLGHTGGTLDKLGAIPGYVTTPDIARLQRVVREVGVAIVGQTAELAPADGRLYAVRDVTSTVESIPLITASILSKKLAAGLASLVMDVKVGAGAFMPTLETARALASSIVEVGRGAGLATTALLTDMDQPLAPCAGNAIEVRCAIDVLTCAYTDEGPMARLTEATFALAAEMLVSARLASNRDAALEALAQALNSGRAAERFAKMVTALGGPSDLLEHPDRHLPRAPFQRAVLAPSDGFVCAIDVRALGMAVVAMGGGRRHAEDR